MSAAAGPSDFEQDFAGLAAIAYRVAYRVVGSRPEAEDIAQEALARAYVRWRRVRGHARPWVARVAGNLALDSYRRTRRAPADRPDETVEGQAAVLDRMELVQLLGRLPKRQREVLVLRYLADLSEADTAASLGCSTGSVKRHAHRALAALRELPADERRATESISTPEGDLDVRPS